MKNRSMIMLLALLGLIIFTTACASATTSPQPASTASTTTLDGASLLQQTLHSVSSTSYVEKSKHTAADWKLIADVMISRGAKLSSDGRDFGGELPSQPTLGNRLESIFSPPDQLKSEMMIF